MPSAAIHTCHSSSMTWTVFFSWALFPLSFSSISISVCWFFSCTNQLQFALMMIQGDKWPKRRRQTNERTIDRLIDNHNNDDIIILQRSICLYIELIVWRQSINICEIWSSMKKNECFISEINKNVCITDRWEQRSGSTIALHAQSSSISNCYSFYIDVSRSLSCPIQPIVDGMESKRKRVTIRDHHDKTKRRRRRRKKRTRLTSVNCLYRFKTMKP